SYHDSPDAMDKQARFARDWELREARPSPLPPIDANLLAALDAGLPACAGVALGVDRLLMAMTGSEAIAGVLAFDFPRA
ncbi:MAG: amino acid--tRNA ligase-related protein, partial [Luteimonas sp.]